MFNIDGSAPDLNQLANSELGKGSKNASMH